MTCSHIKRLGLCPRLLKEIDLIECYFKWCSHHEKDEPFCCKPDCLASDDELEKFTKLRNDELERTFTNQRDQI